MDMTVTPRSHNVTVASSNCTCIRMHARDVESYFTVNLTGKSHAQIVGWTGYFTVLSYLTGYV